MNNRKIEQEIYVGSNSILVYKELLNSVKCFGGYCIHGHRMRENRSYFEDAFIYKENEEQVMWELVISYSVSKNKVIVRLHTNSGVKDIEAPDRIDNLYNELIRIIWAKQREDEDKKPCYKVTIDPKILANFK